MARHGVKKFTTWDYEDRDGATLHVPVQLVDATKTTSGRLGKDDAKTYFLVQLDNPEIDEQDTDINRLRETVFAKIKEQLKIEWRSMLIVTVDSSRSRLFRKELKAATPDTERNAHGKLKLSWERVQIAQHGKNKLQRDFNNYYKPFGYTKERGEKPREVWNRGHDGWPTLGAGENHKHRAGRARSVGAMIPDTPENRLALEAISDQIEKLYDGLSKLLNSTRIEETLAKVAASGLLALSAPKQELITDAT